MVIKITKLAANLVAKNDAYLALPQDFTKFSLNRHYNVKAPIPIMIGAPANEIQASTIISPSLNMALPSTNIGWFLVYAPSYNYYLDEQKNGTVKRKENYAIHISSSSYAQLST
ncbi:hypothetical protein TNCV_4117531 [Trichonephila clavipes]|nr:hypothetical protein TNCV_4117531 [Trichonephila clavipes]